MFKGELFIGKLQKQPEAAQTGSFRCFKSIPAGRYRLSIQASEGHYCSPRKTCAPELYHSMELAIFHRGRWLQINRSKVLREFPRWDELREMADRFGSRCPVFGYVPIDLIDDLYLYLINR